MEPTLGHKVTRSTEIKGDRRTAMATLRASLSRKADRATQVITCFVQPFRASTCRAGAQRWNGARGPMKHMAAPNA